MKLINKLTLGHLIVGIFVIVVALAGMATINNIDRAFNEVSEQTLPVIEALEDVRAEGLKIGGSASEFVLLRAETKYNVTTVEDTEKEQVSSAIKQYDSAILRYEEMVNKFFPEEKYLLENVKTSGRKLQNASTEIIALKEQGASGKIVLEKWEEFEAAKQEFQKTINDAIAYEHNEMAARKQGTENAIAASKIFIQFGGLLTLAVAILLGVFISRTISDPIIKLKDAAVEIGKGKLETRVSIKSGDEVGILAACFNRMAQNLQQAREILRESEEKFRSITTGAMDAIVSMDEDGRIYFMNPAAERMFGYRLEEATGKHLHTLLVPEKYHDACIKGFEDFKKTGEGKVVGRITEISALRKDRSIFPVEISISALQVQGRWHAVGIIRDITERKRMLDALQESEERFRSVVESANEAIIINDARGNITFWNKHAQDIFGYSSDEITGKPVSMIMSGKSREAFEKIHDKIKTNYMGKRFEWIGLRKDGSEFPQEVSLFSWNTDKGAFATAIVSDITERKRIERELEEHREHLEELVDERTREVRLAKDEALRASRVKTDFLMTMSHELRTPLNAVLGFSELLKGKTTGELNEKQERFIDNIQKGGNRLLNIISQILEVVSMENGASELHIEKIPVPEIVDAAIGAILDNASKNNVAVEKNLDPKLEYIEADRQKLMHVFINLLENAVKFSKPGRGVVSVRAERKGDIAEFAISDTGIGIKEEDMGKLFQKFTQLESGTARKYGGTGIGLAVSKQFVELHGGRITVESKFGEGSTFTFSIPLETKIRREK